MLLVYFKACMGLEMLSGRDMKEACFVNLQKLSLDYYNVTSAGHTLSRVMSDTDRIATCIAWVFPDILWGFAYILGVLGVMLSLSPGLAMTIIVIAPIVDRADGVFPEKADRAQPRRARAAFQNHQQLQRGHHGREDQQNAGAGRPPDRRIRADDRAVRRRPAFSTGACARSTCR